MAGSGNNRLMIAVRVPREKRNLLRVAAAIHGVSLSEWAAEVLLERAERYVDDLRAFGLRPEDDDRGAPDA